MLDQGVEHVTGSPATASAAWRDHPPANTARLRYTACSSAESSSYDQSIVASTERCTPARSSASSSDGVRVSVRAAASSMARGRPSSRRLISATAARSPGGPPGRTAVARSTNSSTAALSSPTPSAATCMTCSPVARRRCRLVTSTTVSAVRARIASTSSTTPSSTCSQLSSTTNAGGPRRNSTIRTVTSRPLRSSMPSADATAPATALVSADRCQLAEQHAAGEAIGDGGRRVQGEAGLADATRSGEGDQPRAVEQLDRSGQLVAAADEGVAGHADRGPAVVAEQFPLDGTDGR